MGLADSLEEQLRCLTETAEKVRKVARELAVEKRSGGDARVRCRAGAMILVELKKRSREAFLTAKDLEEDMEKAKKVAEDRQLSLQNLLYEKAYLLKEIERCQNFEMKESSSIPLIPVEEFYKKAPRYLIDDIKTLPEGSQEQSHQLELNRLSHELLLRRSLQEELEGLNQEKEKVNRETAARLEFLDGLPKKMKEVVSATQDIQDHFGERIIERLGRHELCRSLPNPLYMIYCQLEAYGDTFGGVSVSVEPTDPNWTPKGNGGEKSNEMEVDEEEEEEAEEDPNAQTELTAMETSADTQSKRKRSMDLGNTTAEKKPRNMDGIPSIGEDVDLYKDCGVSVKAHLRSKNEQVDVHLRFQYYERLNVVTVEAIDQVGLLANLYPNDTAQYLPHIVTNTNQTLVSPRGTTGLSARRQAFPESMKGRPYKWLQWLAGIYQLTPEGPEVTTQPSTQSIVKSILDRVGAQESLSDQLKSLEQNPHPVPVHPSASDLFPPTATTKLVSWKEIDPVEADTKIAKTLVPKPEGVPTFFRSEAAKQASDEVKSGSSWANFGRRCFFGVLRTESKGTFETIVQVFVDYPRRAPHFTLFPTGDPTLRLIEREVNDYADELHARDELSLLSHQLRRLQMCLDVAASATSSSTGESETVDHEVDHGSSHSSSSLERKRRGRDRRLAFVYDSQSRSFVHR